jgi:hypothetical protein
MNRLERGERIFDICHNLRFAHSSIRTVPDNGDRIKKVLSVKITLNANCLQQGVFVCGAAQPQFYWKELYQRVWL